MKKYLPIMVGLALLMFASLACNSEEVPIGPTWTPTPTDTPTDIPTVTPSNTPTPTNTFTPTMTPSNTPTMTPTSTSTPGVIPVDSNGVPQGISWKAIEFSSGLFGMLQVGTEDVSLDTEGFHVVASYRRDFIPNEESYTWLIVSRTFCETFAVEIKMVGTSLHYLIKQKGSFGTDINVTDYIGTPSFFAGVTCGNRFYIKVEPGGTVLNNSFLDFKSNAAPKWYFASP